MFTTRRLDGGCLLLNFTRVDKMDDIVNVGVVIQQT